jgi:hypothetical protein
MGCRVGVHVQEGKISDCSGSLAQGLGLELSKAAERGDCRRNLQQARKRMSHAMLGDSTTALVRRCQEAICAIGKTGDVGRGFILVEESSVSITSSQFSGGGHKMQINSRQIIREAAGLNRQESGFPSEEKVAKAKLRWCAGVP